MDEFNNAKKYLPDKINFLSRKKTGSITEPVFLFSLMSVLKTFSLLSKHHKKPASAYETKRNSKNQIFDVF
jgi:hypothetical protein